MSWWVAHVPVPAAAGAVPLVASSGSSGAGRLLHPPSRRRADGAGDEIKFKSEKIEWNRRSSASPKKDSV